MFSGCVVGCVPSRPPGRFLDGRALAAPPAGRAFGGAHDVGGEPVGHCDDDRLDDTLSVPLVGGDDDGSGCDADTDGERRLQGAALQCLLCGLGLSEEGEKRGAGWEQGQDRGTVQIAAGAASGFIAGTFTSTSASTRLPAGGFLDGSSRWGHPDTLGLDLDVKELESHRLRIVRRLILCATPITGARRDARANVGDGLHDRARLSSLRGDACGSPSGLR